jgi:hypothetical protein
MTTHMKKLKENVTMRMYYMEIDLVCCVCRKINNIVFVYMVINLNYYNLYSYNNKNVYYKFHVVCLTCIYFLGP